LNHFDLSQQLGIESSEEVSLYQAEAALGLENFQQSQNYLSAIKKEEFKKLPYYLISSEIAWKSGDKKKAWRVLEKALDRNFSKQVIRKKKFYFLLEEGLYQTASLVAQKMLSDKNSFNDVLAMASQLRQKGQFDLSLNLLQSLKVLRPKREMVALEMAQNYLAKKESFSAALILEESARLNPSLSYEAAELLRQLGKSYRAEFLNMSTSDPEKRLKQKLSLFLEDDDYHSLKFLIPELKKHDLLDDQDIRYAVAYSLFRTGDFSKSETLLNTIDKEGLFEKSIELKKEIGNCKESKWACRETI
jgi:thioredoxin-like negative regulator of GroEL